MRLRDFAVDAEHGVMSPIDIANMIRAGQGAGCPVLVRAPPGDDVHVGKSLDAGADGIIFPKVESGEEAAAVASLIRHPPVSRRGLAFHSRNFRYGLDRSPEDIPRVEEDLLCGVMIETPSGVEKADDILRSPIDFVLFGPNDLRSYLGFDRRGGQRLQETIASVGKRAAELSVPAAIPASTPAAATGYGSVGYSIFVCNVAPLICTGLTEYRSSISQALSP